MQKYRKDFEKVALGSNLGQGACLVITAMYLILGFYYGFQTSAGTSAFLSFGAFAVTYVVLFFTIRFSFALFKLSENHYEALEDSVVKRLDDIDKRLDEISKEIKTSNAGSSSNKYDC